MKLQRCSAHAMAIAALLAAPAWAAAQEPRREPGRPAAAETPRAAAPERPALEERTQVTRHTARIGGQTVAYTATAGTIVIRDASDKPQASVFYVAYTKDGVTDLSRRPIFYSFNGGPGSSSVWMHMGFTGPRRVVYDDEGFMLQPPYRIEDNVHSILDVADIVYIDPVATGYSRMAPGEDPHRFHGVMDDIRSVAEFIRIYTTRHRRWESPKFLIGESYGTTRAAGLVGHLQSEHRMYFNGVVLVSMTNLDVERGEDLSFATVLPHYAATAWYHKALVPELQARPLRSLLDEVERFALGEYLLALAQGDRLPAEERSAVARRVAAYSGLSPEYVLRSDLRIDRGRFRKELLRARGLTVGRLDSRYTGIDKDSAGETIEFDPAMEAWNGPFTAVVNQYFRTELQWETDAAYNIFGDVRPWRRDPGVRVGEMMRRAMTQNPFLRVLVLEGYYDGATDHFSAQYTMSHLDPGGEIKDRISFAFYECGHMMYIRKADLAKAKQDIVRFMAAALPSGTLPTATAGAR